MPERDSGVSPQAPHERGTIAADPPADAAGRRTAPGSEHVGPSPPRKGLVFLERSMPVPDVVEEARRILRAAEERGVLLRLLGGVAIRLRVPGGRQPLFKRAYKDIDAVIPRGASRPACELLESLEYIPDRGFNAVNGQRRLMYHDEGNGRQLDVFIGAFEMCHIIPLGGRIARDSETLPLAELLLTKLQVYELNDKDQKDILDLLYQHPIFEEEQDDGIDAGQVARLCASDWGLWRTCKLNIERSREAVGRYELGDATRQLLTTRLSELWARVEAEPKPMKWRLRDRVGDRVQWYDVPEEVE